MSRKFPTMFMDKILHTPIGSTKNPFGFLIVLSFFKTDFPWIYDLGKELLEVIKSEKSITTKKDAVMEFKNIIEFTFEHPMMREIYGNMIYIKEMPYMIFRYLDELMIKYSKTSKN